MKAFIVTDLHVGVTNTKLAEAIRADAKFLDSNEGLDLFIFGGDIASCPYTAKLGLHVGEGVAQDRIYVPGNHELYGPRPGTSEEMMTECLPELAAEMGYRWLEGRVDMDGVSVIYTPAWHDMSLRVPGWPEWTDEQISETYWKDFSDGEWITYDPVKLCEQQLKVFSRLLVETPESAKALLVVTHYPIFRESYRPYVPRRLRQQEVDDLIIRDRCRITDPFFYSPKFGDVLRAFQASRPSLDTLVVSGHVHCGRAGEIAQGLRYYISDSDYHVPTWILAEWTDHVWKVQEWHLGNSKPRLAPERHPWRIPPGPDLYSD